MKEPCSIPGNSTIKHIHFYTFTFNPPFHFVLLSLQGLTSSVYPAHAHAHFFYARQKFFKRTHLRTPPIN